MRLLTTLALLSSATALADTTATGDVVNGTLLFRVQCAACHGVDGRGGGPLASKLPVSVGNLRDSAFLSVHSDDDIRNAVSKGVARKGGVAYMPAFNGLSSLELADLIAFLREGQLKVADFFPSAQFLHTKTYPLDKGAQDKLQKRIGRPLSAAEAHITVTTFYGDNHPGGPEIVPDDPVQLDKLEPADGKGYLVFTELLQGKGRALYGIALDRHGAVIKVASVEGSEKPALDLPYQAFIGQGDKTNPAPLKPKRGKGAPSAAQEKVFDAAYAWALVGVDLADREEKDRHWADTK